MRPGAARAAGLFGVLIGRDQGGPALIRLFRR